MTRRGAFMTRRRYRDDPPHTRGIGCWCQPPRYERDAGNRTRKDIPQAPHSARQTGNPTFLACRGALPSSRPERYSPRRDSMITAGYAAEQGESDL